MSVTTPLTFAACSSDLLLTCSIGNISSDNKIPVMVSRSNFCRYKQGSDNQVELDWTVWMQVESYATVANSNLSQSKR